MQRVGIVVPLLSHIVDDSHGACFALAGEPAQPRGPIVRASHQHLREHDGNIVT